MKRIYRLSLFFLVLTTGIIVAMDNQGQKLMNAIRTSNINDLKAILKGGFINVCQKVGDKSPVELAYESSQVGLNEDATEIRIAVIDYAFEHFVEITNPSVVKNIKKNTDEFINLMIRCRITREEVIKRALYICTTKGWAEPCISTLISYRLSKNALKSCPTLLSDLIMYYPRGKPLYEYGKNYSLGLWVLWCIQHGAPVDTPNQNGITPLIAILRSCEIINPAYNDLVEMDLAIVSDVIEILLTCGANPNQEYIFENVRYTPITYVSLITQNLLLGINQKAPDILLSSSKGARIQNLLKNTIKPSIPPQYQVSYQVSWLGYLQTKFATITTFGLNEEDNAGDAVQPLSPSNSSTSYTVPSNSSSADPNNNGNAINHPNNPNLPPVVPNQHAPRVVDDSQRRPGHPVVSTKYAWKIPAISVVGIVCGIICIKKLYTWYAGEDELDEQETEQVPL